MILLELLTLKPIFLSLSLDRSFPPDLLFPIDSLEGEFAALFNVDMLGFPPPPPDVCLGELFGLAMVCLGLLEMWAGECLGLWWVTEDDETVLEPDLGMLGLSLPLTVNCLWVGDALNLRDRLVGEFGATGCGGDDSAGFMLTLTCKGE